MTGHTAILHTPQNRAYAHKLIDAAPPGAVVTVKDGGETRTVAQNNLLHRWFADIARAGLGGSEAEIKAECNLIYGRPILDRDDPEWKAAFGYIFDSLSHEAKLKAIRVLDVPFTRRMKVKQLTKYMDPMRKDYAEIGVVLTDPDALKYAGGSS